MTLPPLAWIAAMSLPNVATETGWLVSPFQYAVHEPALAVCRNAKVRYLAPDCWDRVAGLSPLYASKYGAKTCAGKTAGRSCAGRAVAACAVPAPVAAKPITAAAAGRGGQRRAQPIAERAMRRGASCHAGIPLASAESNGRGTSARRAAGRRWPAS